MKFITVFFLLFHLLLLTRCLEPAAENQDLMEVQEVTIEPASLPLLKISYDSLYDRVLGALVGSAIGDAMGAPTEMWSRDDIRLEYGYVDSLDRMVREPSPEGTWDYNLPAGGTTDDTRWKIFISEYFLQHSKDFYRKQGPNPFTFAQAVTDRYETELNRIGEISGFDPGPYENQMRRIGWLQEFAIVAKAYSENEMETYRQTANKFYGGDMACPGLLYSPAIGIFYPGAPELSYEAAYSLSIFDIGYAMDITALTASMVAMAMDPTSTMEMILSVLADIDPKGYFRSRLLGRITYRIYKEALQIVQEARKTDSPGNTGLGENEGIENSLYMARVLRAYELLDEKNQDVPFHAGEIHLINLTALIFTGFDFRKAMSFVINYGRDNDTVAAVTGTILGAFHGFSSLPEDMRTEVLNTNRNLLGIDLEETAERITRQMIEQGVVTTLE